MDVGIVRHSLSFTNVFLKKQAVDLKLPLSVQNARRKCKKVVSPQRNVRLVMLLDGEIQFDTTDLTLSSDLSKKINSVNSPQQ